MIVKCKQIKQSKGNNKNFVCHFQGLQQKTIKEQKYKYEMGQTLNKKTGKDLSKEGKKG